jgi:hypothetical protein
MAKRHRFALQIAENFEFVQHSLSACHPEQGRSPRRTFAGRSMNSPSASNGSFCGGNAADLQSKFPKTLSEQAKAQGVSRSGISNGLPIAFVRKVTFVKKSSKLHARPRLP